MVNAPADKLRIFFALWPTAEACRALAGWQAALHERCGGRAMRADTLHATLVFLGEVEAGRIEALKLAAEEVSARRFELCFGQARYWGHNHIVYAAPDDAPVALLQLVHELEKRLIRHRFSFMKHEFRPHVTLLRNARWTDDPLPEMQAVCWRIKDFVLVQSAPQAGHAHYRVLARFPMLNVL